MQAWFDLVRQPGAFSRLSHGIRRSICSFNVTRRSAGVHAFSNSAQQIFRKHKSLSKRTANKHARRTEEGSCVIVLIKIIQTETN